MNEEAIDWLERLERGDCSERDYRDFDRWISASHTNAQAFEDAKVLAARIDAISQTAAVQSLVDDVLVRTEHQRPLDASANPILMWLQHFSNVISRPAFTGALASTVLVLLGSLWWFAPAAKVHSTKVGEQRVVVLPDNSRVTLDTDSALRLEFADSERRVHITRGRAYFDVAHDKSRPFIVSSNDSEVKALGTAFSVYLNDDWFTVTLREGSVQLSAGHEGDVKQLVMSPGEQVTFRPAVGLERRALADMDTRMSWLDGRLIFSSTPLADVVTQINRYSDHTIRLTSPSLNNIEIDAVFKVGDVDTFLLVLQSSFGLTAMRRLNGEIDLVENTRG